LKGTDGIDVRQRAISLGAVSHVPERVKIALDSLRDYRDRFQLITYPDPMGAQSCIASGLQHEVVGQIGNQTTSADTFRAVQLFQQQGVDLILFAGGDGTARDVCSAMGKPLPVLGIPCGVKMHSAVFAVNPRAAGEIITRLIRGELVNLVTGEVRDIDEVAFRAGQLRTRYFGEMLVPEPGRFVQHVKSGGLEVEELVLDEIAAWVIENMSADVLYLMGSGSTVAHIMQQLGLDNTLLGVDVVCDGQVLVADATESQILAHLKPGQSKLIITPIGGQGHLLGRGNQQLSAAVVRAIGRENMLVVSTRTKLKMLEGRPLLVDTGDPDLDSQLSGVLEIITGYNDAVLYRVSA
jgi:predicted polyphosphate/ATP-dependent NAD kinase